MCTHVRSHVRIYIHVYEKKEREKQLEVGWSLHRRVWGRTMGDFARPNIHCAPTSGGILFVSKAHYEHVQHFTSLCSTDWVEWSGRRQSNRWQCLTSFYQWRDKSTWPPHASWSLNFKPSHGSFHTMLLNADGVLLLFCGWAQWLSDWIPPGSKLP